MEITLTSRYREVLNLIAQGDEIILGVESQIVNELRLAEFITRTFSQGKFDYTVTPKGYEELAKES